MPIRPTRFERRGARIIEGDLRDRELLPPVVEGQDVIFNLSGQSGAVRSMEDPWTDLDVNLRGNLVLLESLRAAQPARRRSCSPDRGCNTASRSGCRWAKTTWRSAVPACRAQAHGRGILQALCAPVRAHTTRSRASPIPMGPGQPKGRTAYGVINRLIHLALANEALTIYGDGAQQRDYVHVADVVDALLVMARRTAANGRAYNVASGVGHADDRSGEPDHGARRRRPRRARRLAGAGANRSRPAISSRTSRARSASWAGRRRDPLRQGLEETVAHYRARRFVSRPRPRVAVSRAYARRRRRGRNGAQSRAAFAGAIRAARWCASITPGPIGEEVRKTGVPFSALGLQPGLRRPIDLLRLAAGDSRERRDDRAHVPADREPLRTVCRHAGAGADRDRHRGQHLRAQAAAASRGGRLADAADRRRDCLG